MSRIFKEEEYAGRQNEILDVAHRLVYTKGYEQMTIQDILDEAGISKGAFYHYFNSKQDLLEALIERLIDEGVAVIEPIANDPHLSAIEKLEHYFTTAAAWKTAHKEYILAMLRIWYADENAIVREKMFSAMLDRVGNKITGIVKQGIEEGVFKPAFPDMVGELIMSLWITCGNRIIDLFLWPPSKGNLQRIETNMASYVDAMERLLGTPPGTLHLIEPDLLKEWMVEPEEEEEAIPPPKKNGARGTKG